MLCGPNALFRTQHCKKAPWFHTTVYMEKSWQHRSSHSLDSRNHFQNTTPRKGPFVTPQEINEAIKKPGPPFDSQYGEEGALEGGERVAGRDTGEMDAAAFQVNSQSIMVLSQCHNVIHPAITVERDLSREMNHHLGQSAKVSMNTENLHYTTVFSACDLSEGGLYYLQIWHCQIWIPES